MGKLGAGRGYLVFAIPQQLRVIASGLFRLKRQFRSAPGAVQTVEPVGIRLQRLFVLGQRFSRPAHLLKHVGEHFLGG